MAKKKHRTIRGIGPKRARDIIDKITEGTA